MELNCGDTEDLLPSTRLGGIVLEGIGLECWIRSVSVKLGVGGFGH